jgi:hypothetical protein
VQRGLDQPRLEDIDAEVKGDGRKAANGAETHREDEETLCLRRREPNLEPEQIETPQANDASELSSDPAHMPKSASGLHPVMHLLHAHR